MQFEAFGPDTLTQVKNKANEWLKEHPQYQLVNYRTLMSDKYDLMIIILYDDAPPNFIPFSQVMPEPKPIGVTPSPPFPEDPDPWHGEFIPIGELRQ